MVECARTTSWPMNPVVMVRPAVCLTKVGIATTASDADLPDDGLVPGGAIAGRAATSASNAPARCLGMAARLRRLFPDDIAALACAHELEFLATFTENEADEIHRLERELLAARCNVQRARHDLRASEEHASKARHSALHDPLTGLPNRHSFDEISEKVLTTHAAHSSAFGLLYMDLDGFKAINDTHGHAIGDELLKVVSSRLQRAVRSQDSVSRHGGDEFLCLLQDVQCSAQIAAIADKLFGAVSAPCQLGSVAVSISPSIGIAIFPGDGDTVETLLRSADSAMFTAKLQRRRHVFFNGSGTGQASANRA